MGLPGTVENAYFPLRRQAGFHYCFFGKQYRYLYPDGTSYDGSSGQAFDFQVGTGGTDFVVTLFDITNGPNDPAGVGTRLQQAGTFMHELGHNLGLGHGGHQDAPHHKPNYLSVMNYSFQMTGLRHLRSDGFLDYSSFTLTDLNESQLDESAGLTVVGGSDTDIIAYGTRYHRAPPVPNLNSQCTLDIAYISNTDWPAVDNASANVNWDRRNGVNKTTTVRADINGDGCLTTLTSWNDWDHLVYDGGCSIGDRRFMPWCTIAFLHRAPQAHSPCPGRKHLR